MARSLPRTLEREKPEMAGMIREAKGDHKASMAEEDAIVEEGIANGAMMADELRALADLPDSQTARKTIWFETAKWVYVGVVEKVGRDYVSVTQACQMPSDGRHSLMMKTGIAPGIEMEPTGGPDGRMHIPIDWMGPWCVWPFKIPSEAV